MVPVREQGQTPEELAGRAARMAAVRKLVLTLANFRPELPVRATDSAAMDWRAAWARARLPEQPLRGPAARAAQQQVPDPVRRSKFAVRTAPLRL